MPDGDVYTRQPDGNWTDPYGKSIDDATAEQEISSGDATYYSQAGFNSPAGSETAPAPGPGAGGGGVIGGAGGTFTAEEQALEETDDAEADSEDAPGVPTDDRGVNDNTAKTAAMSRQKTLISLI